MKPSWALLPGLALAAFSAAAEGAGSDFGYACETCPAAWPELDIHDNNCGGIDQSPIALSDGDARFRRTLRLQVSYEETAVLEDIKSTNVEYAADGPGDNTVTLGQTTYTFDQFHFHTTAEHVVNGERSALEMHFVNRAADGGVLVLAAFIEVGDANPAFEPIVGAIGDPDVTTVDEIDVALGDLLPEDLAFFRYTGSTTTPPCTGGVKWVLLREHVELSENQISAIQSAIREGLNDGFNNNRSIQNREFRRIRTNLPPGQAMRP